MQCPAPLFFYSRVRVSAHVELRGRCRRGKVQKMGDGGSDVCVAGESCPGLGPAKVPVTLAYVLYDQGIVKEASNAQNHGFLTPSLPCLHTRHCIAMLSLSADSLCVI